MGGCFRCEDTRKLLETGRSKSFGSIAKVATRKLALLDAAATLEFLRSPPGNRLEALERDRAGQHSIRINDQRLNDIVLERRGVSPDTAMRLARFFGGDARSWLNLQTAHDLRLTEIATAKEIERTVEPLPHSA